MWKHPVCGVCTRKSAKNIVRTPLEPSTPSWFCVGWIPLLTFRTCVCFSKRCHHVTLRDHSSKTCILLLSNLKQFMWDEKMICVSLLTTTFRIHDGGAPECWRQHGGRRLGMLRAAGSLDPWVTPGTSTALFCSEFSPTVSHCGITADPEAALAPALLKQNPLYNIIPR